MKVWKAVLFFVVLAPMLANAQHKAKKHTELSAAFENARYVYVEAMAGDVMKPGLYPEDRQAIGDVEDGLRDWSRYTVATRRKDADLVFIVRKGRSAGVQGRVVIPGGSRPQGTPMPGQDPMETGRGAALGAEAETGPADDMMRVYITNPDGKLIGPVWTLAMTGGLDGPGVPLLRQLRAEVEKAYPAQPAAPQPAAQPKP